MLALDPAFADDLPLLFEFLGVSGPRAAAPAAGSRGSPAPAPRGADAFRQGAQPQRGGGARGRGPALDRRRERRVRRGARRGGRRYPDRSWSAPTGRSTRPPGRATGRTPSSASLRSMPTRPTICWPRCSEATPRWTDSPTLIEARTRRQPVLHRGDRPGARRERPPRRRARGSTGSRPSWRASSCPRPSRPRSQRASTGCPAARRRWCRRCR